MCWGVHKYFIFICAFIFILMAGDRVCYQSGQPGTLAPPDSASRVDAGITGLRYQVWLMFTA